MNVQTTPRSGSALRVYRAARLLTQREVAALAGLSEQTIHRVEAGAPGSISSLRKIADALDVPVEALLGPGHDKGLEAGGRQRLIANKNKRRVEKVVGTCSALALGRLDESEVERAIAVASPDEISGWRRDIRTARANLLQLDRDLDRALDDDRDRRGAS